jgi:type VI secretion system secreted protein VgrG
VVIDFLNSDPDMPVIMGRFYSAAAMPPWELPANKTQIGILTMCQVTFALASGRLSTLW